MFVKVIEINHYKGLVNKSILCVKNNQKYHNKELYCFLIIFKEC
jgi:hypothetical protein